MKKIFVVCLLLLPQLLFAAEKPAPAGAQSAYQEARTCYVNLKSNSEKLEGRINWEECIRLFHDVAKFYPKSPEAANAKYSIGRLREEMYRYTNDKEDLKKSVEAYHAFLLDHPKDRLSDDAQFRLGVIELEGFRNTYQAKIALVRVLEEYPNGDMVPEAKKYLQHIEAGVDSPDSPLNQAAQATKAEVKPAAVEADVTTGKATLLGIEHWSTPFYAKVVLYFNKRPEYKQMVLPPDDRKIGPRVVLDLKDTVVDPKVAATVPVGKAILNGIRVAKFDESTSRVVFDASDYGSTDIIAFQDNIVVNIYGTKKKDVKTKTVSTEDVRTIAIDPGHGGTDSGAIGAKKTREKDVVLSISKRLGAELKKRGYKVAFTRSTDKFISLDERNALANANKSDLFISIHANAVESRKVKGLQTYYLNNATDGASKRLAERENKSSKKGMSDLERILSTLVQNESTIESSKLAKLVQSEILRELSPYDLEDKGVKTALFYVLVGAKCPSILVETSFISNPEEEVRLKNPKYQAAMAAAIADGVEKYIKVREKDGANI